MFHTQMAIRIFLLFVLFSLVGIGTTKKSQPNSIEELYFNSIESKLNPPPLNSLYGFTPTPDGIHLVYGYNYGKVVMGIENDKIYPSQVTTDALDFDFYVQSCPNMEQIIYAQVQRILAANDKAPAQLLRLLFHDCFIEGCDASVLLTSTTNQVERDAIPNQTLKGFDFIESIKIALENECPGVVSCADIIAVATRDAVDQSGGPFYPVQTGRRDSRASFFGRAQTDIPNPFGAMNLTLMLFAQRGFSPKEMVTLLGAHNIGHINCSLIWTRLRAADPYISADFAAELRQICQNENTDLVRNPEALDDATSPSRPIYGTQYYDVVMRERGLLLSDQLLATMEETAIPVADYAADVDGLTWVRDFVLVMIKLSNLQPLVGSQGEIRSNCSVVN